MSDMASANALKVAKEISVVCSNLLDELRADVQCSDNPELYVAMQLYELTHAEYSAKRHLQGEVRAHLLPAVEDIKDVSKLLQEHCCDAVGNIQQRHIADLDNVIEKLVALKAEDNG